MNDNAIPWLFGLLTAGWFGLMAQRVERNWVLWALAGGFFGLVTTTFVFGLGHAAAIPFSDHRKGVLHIEWTVLAGVLIAVFGGLFTIGLRRKNGDAAAIGKAEPQLSEGPPANVGVPAQPAAKTLKR